MSSATGGDYYLADTADKLTDLYEKIYVYGTIEKIDNDQDLLCDIVERTGIRLINGQIIYTDTSLDDTDDDGLLDGQEINPIPIMRYREIDTNGVKERKKLYEFTWNSDPTNPDSDGDGIGDKDDNRPLEKGKYSPIAGDIVVGELTIVSSTYNGIGHAFLVYRSYINDSINFAGINGGYILDLNEYAYVKSTPSTYDISMNEYFSIGNTSVELGVKGSESSDGPDVDSAGIFYNREFATEIDHFKANGYYQYYNKNRALSREVTQREFDKMLSVHNELNYYKLSNNNCTHVASKAWDKSIMNENNKGLIVTKSENDPMGRPSELKNAIKKIKGNYEFDSREKLGLSRY